MKTGTIIGLTGSIGMGKSTTADMFRAFGIPVWDADSEVHKLYQNDAETQTAFSDLWPDVVVNGAVSRDRLKNHIDRNPDSLKQIEAIVHPRIEKSRQQFIGQHENDIIVLDIPLLFEKGLNDLTDYTAVVFTTPENQKSRVLARKTMTEAQFNSILAKQMPDKEKRAKADFLIETDSLEHAKQQVGAILDQIGHRKNA